MNLTDFATPLAAKNQFIKASFGGFAGSGKTRTAAEFIAGCYKDMKCDKPVLIVDNEKGSRFLIPFFKKAGIPVLLKETTSLADVLRSMQYLKDGEVSFLFVDTLTKVWYQFVKDYRKNKGHYNPDGTQKRRMEMLDWATILPAWQEQFSDVFVECAGSIVFTGRGGYEYEKEEDTTDDRGNVKKGAMVRSGVKMKLAGETPFEPDLNVWMELEQQMTAKGKKVWREAQVMKDRSATIDGKVFKNPTYKDFRPVITFLAGVEVGEVAGASDTANLAPSDDYMGYRNKLAREIETEKIKGIFDKAAIGTSKEDKQLKVLILEKCFGTASPTEIEKMGGERLAEGRQKLEYLMSFYEEAPDKLAYVKQCDVSKVMDPFQGALDK
jgi:hypothetical protein